jgi:hypothetical protein
MRIGPAAVEKFASQFWADMLGPMSSTSFEALSNGLGPTRMGAVVVEKMSIFS